MITEEKRVKKPDWLRVKLPIGEEYKKLRKLVTEHKLNTICESGNCPNMGECWGRGTATFMILGNICTRSCSFCAVATGKPIGVDHSEPEKVADSVKKMGVKHCVITSVDRDDLQDGGSTIWARTINTIRKVCPETTLETLLPDFQGKWDNLNRVLETEPEVVSHNVETVRRLTKGVRIQAKYERSLEVIKRIDEFDLVAKSGIMLGLGENQDDIYETMDDLLAVGCDVLTLGQYLQPTRKHHEVVEFIHPDTFAHYKEIGLEKGFKYIESGPLVRSSYHAERHVIKKHA